MKVKLNSTGIKEVLKSQFMMDAIMNEGEKLGEVETSFVGFDRCHAIVRSEDDRTDR